MAAEQIKCNRWPDTDLDEKYLQKFEAWHSAFVSIAQFSHRLLSSVVFTGTCLQWGRF